MSKTKPSITMASLRRAKDRAKAEPWDKRGTHGKWKAEGSLAQGFFMQDCAEYVDQLLDAPVRVRWEVRADECPEATVHHHDRATARAWRDGVAKVLRPGWTHRIVKVTTRTVRVAVVTGVHK